MIASCRIGYAPARPDGRIRPVHSVLGTVPVKRPQPG